ncbi:hypothetical protein O0I10_011034 [Lichtheimia ornata]|uniref:Endonuclease/exonuclease/phosphatase domain-containing protein n=1 Tax=Lichtheimia ornata TaxID=688661 RepID=A0AAD7XSY6_9FUNG|nr:uncharacterized protein O0I10_011034 [Lichtheimia ornata]KAJ8653285.1 hypothetical protein O0I10_011034 [Lichtheimia ornata]
MVAPGELLTFDYRASDSTSSIDNSRSSLKIVQWNVERNYESKAIIDTLKELDADVYILQEIDIGCRRSGSRDHMKELCKALKVKGGFVCEFLEIDSPIRQPRDEGGGVHGNAILSKHDIEFRVLQHQYHGYDWDHEGEKLREPRIGQRYTLAGTVHAAEMPPILCYCVHLEVFTGIIGRVSSFSEVLEDARQHSKRIPHQVIGGDLNTMAHTIARLSWKYARDRYRFLSLGDTESGWWDSHVLSFHDHDGPVNTQLMGAAYFLLPQRLARWLSGFSEDVLRQARNPGFYDPWSAQEVTLENPAYFGLFKAKLDWTLLRCLRTVKRARGNDDYRASDHKYLMVQVVPDTTEEIKQEYALWKQRRREWNYPVGLSWTMMVTASLLVAATATSIYYWDLLV